MTIESHWLKLAQRWALWLIPLVCVADSPGDFHLETLAENLQRPFALAVLPDGDILITENPGRLRRVSGGKLLDEPVAGVPPVYSWTQGGLLDLALHPGFAENGWLYFTFASGDADQNALNVGRGRYLVDESGNARLADVAVILSAPPERFKPVHYGSRLAFMDDGTLLVTVGERSIYREQAQALDRLLGKTLRMTAEGGVPADNPFVGRADANPYVWTYGHRNPQGLVVDSRSGAVFGHEHGPQGGDELNRLAAGGNYGWPIATHGIDYSGGYITPFEDYPGVVPPLTQWTPSLAPSALAQCRACLWPAWEGDLLVTMLRGRQLRRLVMERGEVVREEPLFTSLGERLRDVRLGGDGALYLLTDGAAARLLRVTPGAESRDQ